MVFGGFQKGPIGHMGPIRPISFDAYENGDSKSGPLIRVVGFGIDHDFDAAI